MTGVSIRAGKYADLAALTSLNAEVHGLHFARRPDQFKPVDLGSIERSLVELLGNSTADVWVAELSGSLVGYAVVQRHKREESPWFTAQSWWQLDQVGVAEPARRSGVGRALIQRVLAEAKEQGVTQVELCSWAFNEDAHAAFERLGFVPKVHRFEHR